MALLALLAWEFGMGLAIAAVVAWIVAWVVAAIDIVKRRDLSLLAKVIWIIVVIAIPLVGLFIYYIAKAAS
jgi:Phospholipase_D-nuclease N-terminal